MVTLVIKIRLISFDVTAQKSPKSTCVLLDVSEHSPLMFCNLMLFDIHLFCNIAKRINYKRMFLLLQVFRCC